MKARQRKKNYKKIYGYNPPKPVNYEFALNSIADAMPKMITILKKWISDAIDSANELIENIKEMSEEEFNEKILHSELTLEQITMAKTIRYGRGGDD